MSELIYRKMRVDYNIKYKYSYAISLATEILIAEIVITIQATTKCFHFALKKGDNQIKLISFQHLRIIVDILNFFIKLYQHV